MGTISLEMAKMESLLLSNRKFAKQWLKNLKRHQNDCPCKLNKYTNVEVSYNYNNINYREPCPFDLRKYGKSCFSCYFATLIHNRQLNFYHYKFILNNVLLTKFNMKQKKSKSF